MSCWGDPTMGSQQLIRPYLPACSPFHSLICHGKYLVALHLPDISAPAPFLMADHLFCWLLPMAFTYVITHISGSNCSD